MPIDWGKAIQRLFSNIFPPEGHFACISCSEIFPNAVKKSRWEYDPKEGRQVELEFCPKCFEETRQDYND